jgi:SWI/SNF-related matrix-associated actin-dependent regulator 1 of chromatin subfamily A
MNFRYAINNLVFASFLFLIPPTATVSCFSSQPSKKKELFPYQQEGVQQLIKAKRLLLADEMGLGKTVQCIEAINRVGKDNDDAIILIICPKSVLGVWESELRSWLDLPLDVKITNPKEFSPPSEGTVTLINYDLCHKFREGLRRTGIVYDVLICDEAHYLKSLDAKRTKAILGTGKDDTPCIASRYLWLLTGTPILNRPVELYPLLRAINPIEFNSFKDYTNRYCDPKTTRDGRGNYRVDYTGATNLLELSQRLGSIMLRRYKIDVLAQLPPKFRSCKCLLDSGEADSERERIQGHLMERDHEYGYGYDEGLRVEDFGSEASSLVQYLGRDINMGDPDMRNQIMGFISSIRKETALLKVDVSAELLENIMLSEKVIVFAHHRDVILRLMEKFGERAVCVLGGMSTEERSDAVSRFQNDPDIRIFVGSIRAAGVGLTLTASSHVVFLEMDWVSEHIHVHSSLLLKCISPDTSDMVLFKTSSISSTVARSNGPSGR